ncbi:transposase [Marinobacter sp. LV10MA510-1]|nr:transposase [Marinobacter sp. LV10MA510-1]
MTASATTLTEAQVEALTTRVQHALDHDLALPPEDVRLLLDALMTLAKLQAGIKSKRVGLHKLRKLAGLVDASEKLSSLLGTATGKSGSRKASSRSPATSAEPPAVEAVPPTVEHHALEDVSKGDDCPECETGKLYKYDPASFVRIESQPPFNAVQHVAERLRCNACGVFITATLPDSVLQDGGRGQKYGYGARALMAMNKYFAGHPFYRQGTLNQLLGVPMTASTIFDQCEHLANDLKPVHDTLLKLAADAWLYHIDDTGNRILDQKPVMKRSRHDGRERLRSGIHTSGMIAEQGDGPPLVLYQTSLSHAGELLDDVLRLRSDGSPPPLVMSDALSSNHVSRTPLRIALCNAHGRRNFADLVVHFPEEAEAVLTRYQLIWQHDTEATEQQMTAAQRLAHHREHSLPVMEDIRRYGADRLAANAAEANSSFGQAVNYFNKHFDGLSAFCRHEGAPLDNNRMERGLKLPIRNRKNAMFFKSAAGAAIADVITSVIATCAAAGINPLIYLRSVQRHASEARQSPQSWLPWTYQSHSSQDVKAA